MPNSSPMIATIEGLSQRVADNFNNGDFSALAEMFGEDAVLLPPGTAAVAGREDIRTFWRQSRQFQSIAFDPGSVKPLGEYAARESGIMLIGLRGNQQRPAREVRAKYLSLWQQVDGKWHLESCIWNIVREGQQRPVGAQGTGQDGLRGGGGGGGRYNQPNRGGQGGGGQGGRGGGQGGGGQGGGGRFNRGGQGGGGQGGRGGGQGGGGQGGGGGRYNQANRGGGGRSGINADGPTRAPFVPRVG
jgi:uncharacterized protein (TIGR02246 family)